MTMRVRGERAKRRGVPLSRTSLEFRSINKSAPAMQARSDVF